MNHTGLAVGNPLLKRSLRLNYDLFAYWAGVTPPNPRKDGFAFGDKLDGLWGPFNERSPCELWHLHGALHLFEEPSAMPGKIVWGKSPMVSQIAERMGEGKMPLFVAEGSCARKQEVVNASKNLTHCFDQLRATDGAVFTFGHSASINDKHVYQAIFESEATHLYFGWYCARAVPGIKERLCKWRSDYGSVTAVPPPPSDSAPDLRPAR